MLATASTRPDGADIPVLQLFQTAADVSGTDDEDLCPVLPPYMFRGTITKLDGKAKSAGKTTLMLDACRAKLTGGHFLGHPTTAGPVVYLTEQSKPTFKLGLRRAGLVGRVDLHVLYFKSVAGRRWSDVVAAAGEKCRMVGADLLIIDTVHQFMELEGESENQSGTVLRAMACVQALVADGALAVCLIAHERKGGGDIGDSGRGSTAFSGSVDTILQLTRLEGQGPRNRRVLKAMGRLDTPPQLIIERQPVKAADPLPLGVGVPAEFTFVVLGDDSTGVKGADEAALLAALPRAAGDALAIKDLAGRLGKSRTVIQSAIEPLYRAGVLHRCGTGKRGDAYRYYRADDGAGTPTPGFAAATAISGDRDPVPPVSCPPIQPLGTQTT